MNKRRTIKAALTAATIAIAVTIPVGTASAANATTASPQVNIQVFENYYYELPQCQSDGASYVSKGANSYNCLWDSWMAAWDLYTYWS